MTRAKTVMMNLADEEAEERLLSRFSTLKEVAEHLDCSIELVYLARPHPMAILSCTLLETDLIGVDLDDEPYGLAQHKIVNSARSKALRPRPSRKKRVRP